MKDEELMFTAEEIRSRAEGYAREKRAVEAGWMTRIASSAPKTVSQAELYVSRGAFFAGVKFMMDIIVALSTAGSVAGPKITREVIDDIEIEIKVFLASDPTVIPDPPGPKGNTH